MHDSDHGVSGSLPLLPYRRASVLIRDGVSASRKYAMLFFRP